MQTCGPGQIENRTPGRFFVASAILACYGRLPERENDVLSDVKQQAKRPRTYEECDGTSLGTGVRPISLLAEYDQMYMKLRAKLLELQSLVRAKVLTITSEAESYAFMNIYGLCSLRISSQPTKSGLEPLTCKFSGTKENIITVFGELNPILGARSAQSAQGQIQLACCSESDYQRTVEESLRLHSVAGQRYPSISRVDLGHSVGSMENRFVLNVREDLHAIGCAYGQLMGLIELLHINQLLFLHS